IVALFISVASPMALASALTIGQPTAYTAYQPFNVISPLYLNSSYVLSCPTCGSGGGGTTYTGNNPIFITASNAISFNSLWLPPNNPYTATNGIKITTSNIIFANTIYPITNTSNEIGLSINSSNLQLISNQLSIKLSGLPS